MLSAASGFTAAPWAAGEVADLAFHHVVSFTKEPGVIRSSCLVSLVSVTTVRRSVWLDERVALLLGILAEYGMVLPEDTAREVISGHLDTTARLMRVGPQAAEFYVTHEVVSAMADQILGIDKARRASNVISLAAERRKRQ